MIEVIQSKIYSVTGQTTDFVTNVFTAIEKHNFTVSSSKGRQMADFRTEKAAVLFVCTGWGH